MADPTYEAVTNYQRTEPYELVKVPLTASYEHDLDGMRESTLDEIGLERMPTQANFLMHRISGDLSTYRTRMARRGSWSVGTSRRNWSGTVSPSGCPRIWRDSAKRFGISAQRAGSSSEPSRRPPISLVDVRARIGAPILYSLTLRQGISARSARCAPGLHPTPSLDLVRLWRYINPSRKNGNGSG